jgi:pimeloyl-ACP methyl ester carboxylesterase
MLWGEGDPWMKCKERGEKFKQYYQNLTEYYLQAGHCPHDEIPEQVNQLIRDWVREKSIDMLEYNY